MNILKPKHKSNLFLHSIGLLFMALNKARHLASGYKTPRTFSMDEISRNIDYTQKVCDEWEDVLVDSLKTEHPFRGRDILEVGPGPDLGNGVVLIARGAKSYTAIDKNNLIRQADDRFYEELLKRLKDLKNYESARSACERFLAGQDSPIRFIHDPEFHLEPLKPETYDLMVSRAAIEHIENVEEFFGKIREALRPGGSIAALIDGKTHTRWIRDVDPLNILRYSPMIYNLLSFSGSPNRWRMADYVSLLERLDFRNLQTEPYEKVSGEYVQSVRNSLSREFRDYPDLERIVFWVLACL